MNELALEGCRLEPVGSYLKALGVLRLVGTQVDAEATGHWDGDSFVLRSRLDRDGLVEFFLQDYRPTPVMSPWNKDGGITATELKPMVAVLRDTGVTRLGAYAESLVAAQTALRVLDGWEAAKDGKEQLVAYLRARLPDEALAWLDAVQVLTPDGLKAFPLLGSGGNDGRHEFSHHFMQRLVDALALVPPKRPPKGAPPQVGWLRAALFDDRCELGSEIVGMFYPGFADVPSSPIGSASVSNPWDIVLLVEGVVLFAGSAARRYGQGRLKATMPFMVDAVRTGNPSGAASEEAFGELWAPVWRVPVRLGELARLLAEGRCEWAGRQASSGLDAVRAVASLGVDRGVESFVRHTIAKRRGQNRLVQPAGRIVAREGVGVSVLAQADRWVNAVRYAQNQPPAVAAALRGVDDTQWAYALHPIPANALAVLSAFAGLEAAISRSPTFRDDQRRKLAPWSSLVASDWLGLIDDGSAEVRLAASFVAQRDGDWGASPREYLVAVQRERGRPAWRKDGPLIDGLGRRGLPAVLAALVQRRVVERAQAPGDHDGQVGVQPAFGSAPVVTASADVADWVAGLLDDLRLAQLIEALAILDWRGTTTPSGWLGRGAAAPPPAWAVLAPFFHGRSLRDRDLRPDGSWPARLAVGQVEGVVRDALMRLRMARLAPVVTEPGALAATADGPRLAASLLFPLPRRHAEALLSLVCPDLTESLED